MVEGLRRRLTPGRETQERGRGEDAAPPPVEPGLILTGQEGGEANTAQIKGVTILHRLPGEAFGEFASRADQIARRVGARAVIHRS